MGLVEGVSRRESGLARLLWWLGFHWNQRRGAWQHLCGMFDPLGSHSHRPSTRLIINKSLFGPVVYAYTRKQAVADSLQVDVAMPPGVTGQDETEGHHLPLPSPNLDALGILAVRPKKFPLANSQFSAIFNIRIYHVHRHLYRNRHAVQERPTG
jgi:hypothetical protein